MGAHRADLGAQLTRVIQATSARTTWGLRAEGIRTRYQVSGSDSLTPPVSLRGRRWIGTAIAEHDREITSAIRWRAGGAVALTQGRLALSPHARLQYQPLSPLTLSVAWRRSHQFVQSLRNTESLAGNVFPADLYLASGIGAMPIARTDQGVMTASIAARGLHLNAQAYARTMRGLALVAPVTGEPFATGAPAIGTGTARGASLDVMLTRRRWTATASYGVQFVEYATDSLRYVPDHGARHLMEAGVIVFPTPSSSIRVGLAAEAGRRTTLSSGAFEWEACNLKDRACEFGGSPRADGVLGGTTLPGYSRVDVGLQKHWHVTRAGRDGQVSLFGAFTNVIGRRNVLTLAADPVTGRRSGVEMRPQSPLVFGLDWTF